MYVPVIRTVRGAMIVRSLSRLSEDFDSLDNGELESFRQHLYLDHFFYKFKLSEQVLTRN
jgi:hypothetical protein